jgi:glyoxylase-like metal-dependent hydrolase (beta-lactamase superfamily II)
MQEIAHGIYFETAFPGVTLGAIKLPRGTILVDAPLRPEDARSWRAALFNRGSNMDKILVNLDAHPDRTIGSRSLECPVIMHERCEQIFRNRPPTFKGQNTEVGAEWETCLDLGSSRWALPDITFTDGIQFHWGELEVFLEYHPGPAPGASWIVIPEEQVVFVGDALVVDQPPFLADADIPVWLETLDILLSSRFRNYMIVSGRGGLTTPEQIRSLKNMLKKIDKKLTSLWEKSAPVDEVYKMVPGLMSEYETSVSRQELYQQRLIFGLERYYTRYIQPDVDEIVEEEIR